MLKSKKKFAKRRSVGANLVFFDTLFRGIWMRMVPLLGVTNLYSLLEHARAETSLHYPALNEVRIRQDGLNFEGLKKHINERTGAAVDIEKGLWIFLETFTTLSAELSGDMIAREVTQYVRKQRKGKVFGKSLYRTDLNF